LYDAGKITLEEMMDKSRQPGALQDKALAKMSAIKGRAKAARKAAVTQEMKDIGPILRT
jgi:hypothetical protein